MIAADRYRFMDFLLGVKDYLHEPRIAAIEAFEPCRAFLERLESRFGVRLAGGQGLLKGRIFLMD